MYHAVKVVLILQMSFIEPNQQKIIKITGFLLKLWNDGDLQFSLAGKLIAKKRLTGAVDVISSVMWNLLYILRNKSLYMEISK